MKTLKILSIAVLVSLIIPSCTDYLDEVNKLQKTADLSYYSADALANLVAVCYSYNKVWYGKEAGMTLSEGGVDLWYDGRDNTSNLPYATYRDISADLTSFPADQLWEGFYSAINLCNIAEERVEDSDLLTEEVKKQYLSEVRFLRAWYYWNLVETWGPVPLNIKPVTVPSTEATRNSEDEIYAQMFTDVQYAIDNLGPTVAPSGRVTYLAAKAFKARLALYYASAYHGHTDYYATAAQEAQDVINNSLGKSLYDNYSDVWDMLKSSTTTNNELIWAVEYHDVIDVNSPNPYNNLPVRLGGRSWDGLIIRNATVGIGGNCQHLFYTPIYNNQSNSVGGANVTDVLIRYTGVVPMYTVQSPATRVGVDLDRFYVPYAMGYTRYAPTKYLIDLFNETMDQRWDVSFRSVWYKHPDVVPRNYPDTATCAYPKMSTGTDHDTCLWVYKHRFTQTQRDWAQGRYKILDVDNTFNADGTPTTPEIEGGRVMFIAMRKFENTDSKIALLNAPANFNDYFSYRDFPIFRMSEMYLIAAEALLGTDKGKALQLINELRTKRAITGKEADMQISNSELDIDFILEERARELCAENQRWFDLKRTMKLEQQIQNNPNARDNFDASKHYLRPIPSVQMNAVSNRSETPGVGFWQNNGY